MPPFLLGEIELSSRRAHLTPKIVSGAPTRAEVGRRGSPTKFGTAHLTLTGHDDIFSESEVDNIFRCGHQCTSLSIHICVSDRPSYKSRNDPRERLAAFVMYQPVRVAYFSFLPGLLEWIRQGYPLTSDPALFEWDVGIPADAGILTVANPDYSDVAERGWLSRRIQLNIFSDYETLQFRTMEWGNPILTQASFCGHST
eukprot:scaffold83_cov181-Amphora_coffeaeformis.AAC.8